MRDRFRRSCFVLAALPLLAALAGCGASGGGAGTAGGDNQAPGPAAQASPPAVAFHPKRHHDSGGGSGQFIVRGGDNSVQEFGAEAGEAQLHQAAAALHGFLDARAERNWAAACGYLANPVTQGFAQRGGSAPKSRSCVATLAALTGKTPTSTLHEAAIADVGALRAQGGRGFLLYRGAPRGTIYAIPVVREAGRWELASLAGTPLD